MDEFFVRNIIGVFFFYGLAFFSMGLAIFLEISHSPENDFAQALVPLAGFGLVHGSHEWFEMGLIIYTFLTGEVEPDWVFYLRLILLGVSFILLFAFGIRLILGPGRQWAKAGMLAAAIILWGIGLIVLLDTPQAMRSQLIAADVYTRYSLAIPAAILTTWGLILQRNRFQKSELSQFGNDVILAAVAFALYGGIGQLFAASSDVFPSNYLNSTTFQELFGFPIQGFRALMAIFAAIFIIRSLRAFDEEKRRRLQALRDSQIAEQQRLQGLRSELLHRTVQAQEQERQRIAHELHDETGQTLTALGLGLRGLASTITNNPEKAANQTQQLEALATSGLSELQRLVYGLRPPQLDELGLAAGLRWFTQEISERYNIPIPFNSAVDETRISDEVRLTFFRIAQEAITNAIRHANATRITVKLMGQAAELILRVEDDGTGFEVEQVLAEVECNCLGLMGMIERANLIGAECLILSDPGRGTIVEVTYKYGPKG
jgi:signal transduction histidine kinase